MLDETQNLVVTPPTVVGRRERKKAETRSSIARAALELFLAHGFDEVSIRQIAERADVAVATVFAHFPGKEALVFDEDDAVSASLLAAIQGGPEGDLLAGLETWFLSSRAAQDKQRHGSDYARFRALVDATPALHAYWQTTWRRHRADVARALIDRSGAPEDVAELVAALVIEGYLLAVDQEDPTRTLHLLFSTLRRGLAQRA